MSTHFGQVHNQELHKSMKMALLMALAFLTISCCALLIIFGTSDGSQESSPVVIQSQAKLETTAALIPIQSIATGEMLEPSMFRIEMRAKSAVSAHLVSDYEQITNTYARTLIIPNQPLYSDFLTHERPTNALTALIPDGYRAVTIRVDERTSIEGWARAGAKVDVSWTSSIRGKAAVTVIVHNAKVISAARKVESENQKQIEGAFPTELTLLVTNEDSNKILLAQLSGTLSLSLRGDKESGHNTDKNTITTDDLLGKAGQFDKEKAAENIIKIKGSNGEYEEFVLRNGRLIPFFQDLTSGANSMASFNG